MSASASCDASRVDGAEAAQAEHRRLAVPAALVRGRVHHGRSDRRIVRLGFTDYNLIQPPSSTASTTSPGCSRRAAAHALGVTFTYVFVSVPLQLAARPGAGDAARPGLRGLAFYRSAFYLPSLLGASVAIAMLWRQIFGADGLVNQRARAVRHPGPGLDLRPGHGAVDPDRAEHLDVRRADGHLPGRAAADPRRCTTRPPRSTAPAGGRSSATSRCRCSRRSSSSTWCCRSSTRSSRSPRRSSSPAARGGPSDSTLFYTLYLYQRGLHQLRHGLRLGAGLAAAGDHRRVHRRSTSGPPSSGSSTMTELD